MPHDLLLRVLLGIAGLVIAAPHLSGGIFLLNGWSLPTIRRVRGWALPAFSGIDQDDPVVGIRSLRFGGLIRHGGTRRSLARVLRSKSERAYRSTFGDG